MKPLNFNPRKAFTMLELVFVIVIVGILSYFAAASFQRNTVQEAADQIVSHIRYTQHLAMVDDKFSPTTPQWYRNQWHITFGQDAGSSNEWVYSILSANQVGTYAKNPLDNTKLLSSLSTVTEASRTKELGIQKKYGVTNVTFTNCPTSTTSSLSIYFDNLGRPYGNKAAVTAPYTNLFTGICIIVLGNGNAVDNITIEISPETGYVTAHK